MACAPVARAPQCLPSLRRVAGGFSPSVQYPAAQQIRGLRHTTRKPKFESLQQKEIPGAVDVVPWSMLMGNPMSPSHVVSEEDLLDAKETRWKIRDHLKSKERKALRRKEKREEMMADESGSKPSSKHSQKATTTAVERAVAFLRQEEEAKRQKEKEEEAKKEVVQDISKLPLSPKNELKYKKASWSKNPGKGVHYLDPERAIEVLEDLIPESLEFRKPVVTLGRQIPFPVSPSLNPADLAAAHTDGVKAIDRVTIYGHVKPSHIVEKIGEILIQYELGQRVKLSEEDVSFKGVAEGFEKVHHLGSYEYEIRLPETSQTVRRLIAVRHEQK